ncbi:MAG: nitrite reductase small subunit NirD [Actinomycetota bacterium]
MTDLVHDASAETPEEQRSADVQPWTRVCAASAIRPERGVAALVDDVAVAIFRLPSDDGDVWCCVDHEDPVTGVGVMARGLVGSTGPDERPTVASPLYKERYDLITGQGVDDPTMMLRAHRCRVRNGQVEVQIVDSETVTLR